MHDTTLGGDDMVFLAQIAHEPQAKNCIGDAAPIFIAVSTSDPIVIRDGPVPVVLTVRVPGGPRVIVVR